MPGLLRQAGRRLGYRGAALLICGTGWINWGLSLLSDPRYGTTRGAAALTHLAPMPVWAWVWIASGVLSCAAAALPSRRDWWGWLAAVAMPVIWAAAYTGARALGEFPQGLGSGLTWLVSPGLTAVVAVATRRLVMLRREVATLRRTTAPPPPVREEDPHG
ncbi:hypothetical protein [Streptomyces sp. NPDC088923]|uniref:hypothetical protein n=1 Tax=Streptomyces sp. NPDC088923 TaxID=3365913 RepID=UPI003802A784